MAKGDKKYKIQYLGRGRTIDIAEARCPIDAIRSVVNPTYFTATEIKEKVERPKK